MPNAVTERRKKRRRHVVGYVMIRKGTGRSEIVPLSGPRYRDPISHEWAPIQMSVVRVLKPEVEQAPQAVTEPSTTVVGAVKELTDVIRAVADGLQRQQQVPLAYVTIPLTEEFLGPLGLTPGPVKKALDGGQLTRPKTSYQEPRVYILELLEWQKRNGLAPKLARSGSKSLGDSESGFQDGRLHRRG